MPPFDDSAFATQATTPDAAPELSAYSQTPGVAPVSTTAPALSQTGQHAFSQAVAYGLPGLGVGFLDTLGQSLGVLHDNTMPDMLKSLSGDGANSFGDFYARNQQPLRTGGEIAGMLLPGLAAMKALKTVKMAREAGSFGEALASSDTWSGKAMDVLLGNSADLTAKETAIANATYDAKAAQGVWAGRTIDAPAVNAAKRGYYAARAVDAARTTIAFELGNRVAFNSSSTFYPPDYTLTDQLLWSGAGLAGGVGLDLVAARYAVRNLVQSAVNGFTKNAQELGTVEPSVAALESGKDVDKTIFRANQRGLGITQYSALSQDLDTTAQSSQNAQLKTNLVQDQTNIKAVLSKQIGLMGYDTHAFLPRTALSDDQIGNVTKALKSDPTTLLYATKLANVPDDAEDFYQDIAKQTATAKNNLNAALTLHELNPSQDTFAAVQKANATFLPLEKASQEMHYVIENDGRYSIFKNRADNWLDDHSFGDIKQKRYITPDPKNPSAPGIQSYKSLLKGDNDLVIHDNFRMEIPAGAKPIDFSALYAGASKMIANYKPAEGQEFVLTPQVNWRTLEATTALAEKYPAAQSAIRLGEGFSSLDDVKFHVLNQKFQGFLKDMDNTSQQPLVSTPGSLLNKIGGKLTPAQVIQKYNLPEPTLGQPSPIIEAFAHGKLQGMNSLYDMFPVKSDSLVPSSFDNMDLLQAHLRETAGIKDPKVNVPIQGPLLNQTDTKPVFVASTGAPLMKRADAMIGGMVQVERDIQLEKMSQIDPISAPLVTGVIGKILSQGREGGDLIGSANIARGVQTLQDGVLSGTGQVVYQDRINEQFPTLKALQLIAQDTDNFTRQHVANLSATQLSPKLASILQAKNRADLFDFNRIEQSYRHGWDITGFLKNPKGDGYIATLAADDVSRINGPLKAQHFGDMEPSEISYLPDMSVTSLKTGYKPLIVSKGAVDVANTISDLSRNSGVEYNQLQYALGKSPVKIRDFHLPTPELSREGTWFIRNDTGKVIATYVGTNVKANQQRAIAAADELNKAAINGSTQNIAVPLETVQRDHTIDDDFFNVIDYSDQLAKNNVGIKGGLSHVEIDTTDTTLKSMIYSLQRQYLNLGIRSRAAVFEPEINYASQASQAAGGVSRQNLGQINIFDRYISTMFSQSPVQGKGLLQNQYTILSNGLDKALSWLNGHYSEVIGSAGTSIQAKAMRQVLRKTSSEEEFNQFQKVLPKWNPFDDVAKWQESTFRETPNWNAKDITNRLTQVSTTLALRFLDAGMSVVHFGNMATNLPSVVTALRKLPGESYEQWVSRTAAWGNRITPNIATFSPMKAMSKAAQGYWRGDYTDVLSKAAKLGYFNPEYASLTKLLTAPPTTKTRQYWNTFLSASTYLADHSEIMARKMSWIMGYGIGKELHGFEDDKNAFIFANKFVNDVEGNYSVNNKPAMFSGTIGQPLGAFQTYMTNFYRRMFGYVETQNKAALISQYAAQATVFGARTVPGFNLWNKTFQTNSSGSDDFVTRIEKRFQPGVGELILNGSLDNIPKIWGGLQADGFSWHTRGSADYTELPATLADINRAPPIQFLGEVVKGISQTIGNVFSHEGFSTEEQEEILARMSTNRFMKNVMEMASNVKTDDRGAVIQQGTRDAINVAARLLGTQPASVTNLIEANARERTVQLGQADAREALNMKTRALFQGGEFTIDKLQAITQDYLNQGGNPAYLGQWLRNSMTASMTPKAYATLQELGRSGKLLEFENMLATLQQNQGSNPATNRQGNK